MSYWADKKIFTTVNVQQNSVVPTHVNTTSPRSIHRWHSKYSAQRTEQNLWSCFNCPLSCKYKSQNVELSCLSNSGSALICLIQYREREKKRTNFLVHLAHLFRSGVYTLLFVLLSDPKLHSKPAHPLICLCCRWNHFAVHALYVDLPCNINRTFLSADKCTRTYKSDQYHQGNFGQNSRLSARGSIGFHTPPSYDPAKVRCVVTGKIVGNWIWNTAGT